MKKTVAKGGGDAVNRHQRQRNADSCTKPDTEICQQFGIPKNLFGLSGKKMEVETEINARQKHKYRTDNLNSRRIIIPDAGILR